MGKGCNGTTYTVGGDRDRRPEASTGTDAVIPLDIADAEVSLIGDSFDGEPVAVAEGFELAGGCAAAAHISQAMRPPLI